MVKLNMQLQERSVHGNDDAVMLDLRGWEENGGCMEEKATSRMVC